MTAYDFAERLAEQLVADPQSAISSAGVRVAGGFIGGNLRPAVDVELVTGEAFRLLVDRVELEAAR